MVTAIYMKKKVGLLIVIFVMLLAGIISSIPSTNGGVHATSKKYIYISSSQANYKSIGQNRMSKSLPPGVYRQYAKKNSWVKVKNRAKKFVWIKNAKNLDALKTTKYLKIENEIIRLVNIERKKRNLNPLKKDNELQRIAFLRSDDMAKENYFGHISPRYGRWAQLFYTSEYPFKYAGENLAAGFTTPKAYVDAWMNSPSHRANILNRNFTKIAVAIVPGTAKSKYSSYATQWFAK